MTKILAYRCDSCKKIYEDKSTYIEHLKTHIIHKKYNKLVSESLDGISRNIKYFNSIISENPYKLIGENASKLLTYCLVKATAYNNRNTDMEHYNKIKNCEITRVDIKKTSGCINIIARINHAGFYQRINVPCFIEKIHFENLYTCSRSGRWSRYYSNNIRDEMNVIFSYTPKDNEYESLSEIWIRLYSKSKLKSEAKKMNKNTFRILN